MKKIALILIAVIALAGCTAVKGESKGEWEVIVTGTLGYSALYRYVDKEYGVVIYVGDNHRMTSQKIDKNFDGVEE